MNIVLWQTVVVSAVLATCVVASALGPHARFAPALVRMVHGVACALWFGATVWVAGFQGVMMLQILPRHPFNLVQRTVFPVFFRFGDICMGLALSTFFIEHPPLLLTDKAEQLQAFNLVICFLCTLANSLLFVPAGSQLSRQCEKMEKDVGLGQTVRYIDTKPLEGNEKYRQLRATFGVWHELSRVTGTVSCLCVAFRVAYLAATLAAI